MFNIDLDNIPQYVSGVGINADPKIFSPVPPVFGYPPAADGGETPEGKIEGNAADVQTFVGPDGHILAIVSEEDVDPALTELQIEPPAVASHTSRGCAMLGNFTKVYNRPGQALHRRHRLRRPRLPGVAAHQHDAAGCRPVPREPERQDRAVRNRR